VQILDEQRVHHSQHDGDISVGLDRDPVDVRNVRHVAPRGTNMDKINSGAPRFVESRDHFVINGYARFNLTVLDVGTAKKTMSWVCSINVYQGVTSDVMSVRQII
jgi:hypothetical protein